MPEVGAIIIAIIRGNSIDLQIWPTGWRVKNDFPAIVVAVKRIKGVLVAI